MGCLARKSVADDLEGARLTSKGDVERELLCAVTVDVSGWLAAGLYKTDFDIWVVFLFVFLAKGIRNGVLILI